VSRPEIPITVFRSETLTQPFCLVDRRTRLGLDLTGKIVRFTVRAALDEAILISKQTGAGIVHDPDQVASPGKFTLTVPAAEHTALGAFDHRWDLWVDDELWVAPSLYDVRDSVRFGR